MQAADQVCVPRAGGTTNRRLQGTTPFAVMQSAYGNQAVLHLLGSQSGHGTPAGMVQRTCSCGGAGPECSECKKKKQDENGLQRKAVSGGNSVTQVPNVVHEVLRSPGRPLEAGVRHFMEPRFGYDFSDVRIHTDPKAAASAEAVNAQAYTVGRNIVIGRNGIRKARSRDSLLAHELAHVVQQRGREVRRRKRSRQRTIRMSARRKTLRSTWKPVVLLMGLHRVGMRARCSGHPQRR